MAEITLREQLERACIGKMRFYDRQTAKRMAAKMDARYGNGQKIYRCDYCGCWHLTTHPWAKKEHIWR